MGPFSPKTLRLLTSPINLNSLGLDKTSTVKQGTDNDVVDTTSNNELPIHKNTSFSSINLDSENATFDVSIPDMGIILTKFGIEYDSGDSEKECAENTELSISQRIKTLRRTCTYRSHPEN